MSKIGLDLPQLHHHLDRAFNPSYEADTELRRNTLETLLVRLDQAKEQALRLLASLPPETKEQSIKHTLDNTVLEQLPDEIEDNNPLTIHGEK